jgi:aminoglycoside/choline kinase family phosphotransferase
VNDFVARELVRLHGDGAASGFTVLRLEGDASDRRYFRVRTPDNLPDYVVMEILRLESALKSEEVTLYHDVAGELPFLNLQRYLKRLGLPVPQVHRYDADARLMLLEDLGETLLWDVAHADPAKALPFYEAAVDLLVRMQARATRDDRGPRECFAFRQRFEEALLVWEFDHFLEYGVQKKGIAIAEDDLAIIRGEFGKIARAIASAPVVFTHRDYHSRNLMVTGAGLGIIDFQDALLGPPTYDLASLLRDSYVQLPEPMIDGLVARYLAAARAEGIPGTEDAEAFRKLFDRTAIQRNLKAAGRFDYIATVKGNPKFLPCIAPTLGYVAKNLARDPSLADLKDRLAKYVPALGA